LFFNEEEKNESRSCTYTIIPNRIKPRRMKGKEDADQQSGEVIHPLRTEREYPVKILRKTFIMRRETNSACRLTGGEKI